MKTPSSIAIALAKVISLALLFVGASAAAQGTVAVEPKNVSGHLQMSKIIAKAYDRSDAKVVAEPVVASGKFAVVCWSRGDTGGRALFQENAGKWTLVIYGGNNLKDPLMLEKYGVPKENALSISRILPYAEERESPERVKLFGSLSEGERLSSDGKK
jgi:hypothetical protein